MQSLGSGYRALVIGASGGIGGGFMTVLAADRNCADLVGLSRSGEGLDLIREDAVAAQAAGLEGRQFDLILCATGALTIDGIGPEKTIKRLDGEAMARQFALNAIGPALVMKHFLPLLPKSGRGLFGVLSARVGSIGDNELGGWISYRASKAALNQVLRTVAIETGRTRPEAVLAALHPGTVATPLSSSYRPNHQVFAPDESAAMMLSTLDGLEAKQTGGFFAYDGSPVPW